MSGKQPSTIINLAITIENLKNVAGLFKGISDPFVVIYADNDFSTEVGRTEVIKNTLCPSFSTHIQMPYSLATHEKTVTCVVYDFIRGKPSSNLKKHTPMGSCTFSLTSLIRSPGSFLTSPLRNDGGHLTLHAEVVSNSAPPPSSYLLLGLKGLRLKSSAMAFKRSKPYFVMKRKFSCGNGRFLPLFHSECAERTLNPTFPDVQLSLSKLCNGDFSRELLIQIWDFEKSGEHVFMGVASTTLQSILDLEFMVLRDRNANELGRLEVTRAELNPSQTLPQSYSWLDYIEGGCVIAMQIAIDFTGSNGDPSLPNTLHSFEGTNEYTHVIESVGSALLDFDDDKIVDLFGFGMKVGNETNHCLSLGEINCRKSGGIGGVVNSVKSFLNSGIVMSGPTVFSEVLATAIATSLSHNDQEGQNYNVLLIITDGCVDESDSEATKSLCSELRCLALSVVFVCVGGADFTYLRELGLIPNVTVVAFRDFGRMDVSGETGLVNAALAQIPNEITNFFAVQGILPTKSASKDEDDESQSQSEFAPIPVAVAVAAPSASPSAPPYPFF